MPPNWLKPNRNQRAKGFGGCGPQKPVFHGTEMQWRNSEDQRITSSFSFFIKFFCKSILQGGDDSKNLEQKQKGNWPKEIWARPGIKIKRMINTWDSQEGHRCDLFILSQLFHYPLSLSSRGFSVPLHFLHTILYFYFHILYSMLSTKNLISIYHHHIQLIPFTHFTLPSTGPFNSGNYYSLIYTLMFVFLWFSVFMPFSYLFICFFIFHIWMKSQDVCLSPSDLFHLA